MYIHKHTHYTPHNSTCAGATKRIGNTFIEHIPILILRVQLLFDLENMQNHSINKLMDFA